MLETRRKRRESNPKLTIRRMSVFQSSPEGEQEVASSQEKSNGLKLGAKRKMSVREEDEARELVETGSEDFQYTRKGPSTENARDGSHPFDAPERKVLGSSKLIRLYAFHL
jgi:hypothetical protein